MTLNLSMMEEMSMPTILDFFSAFRFEFMQRALVSSLIIGIVCSLIGVFILLKGMVFLGQAIAHSSFAGATLAILLGMKSPILLIMGFSLLSALSIGYVNQKRMMRDEVIIGIVFSAFVALAALFIGLQKEYTSDIKSVLFGNLLTVDVEDFILLIVFSALILLVVFLIKKELYFITFDSELAAISGLPVTLLNYIFLVLISITVAVSLKAIGAILVFAMIITPAAAAYQWTFRINRMILLSIIFGVAASIIGLFASYMLDIATGASIAMTVTIIFIISFIFSPKRRALKKVGPECPHCKNFLLTDGSCENLDCHLVDVPHTHHDDAISISSDKLPEKDPTIHDHD